MDDEGTVRIAALFEETRRTENKSLPSDEKFASMTEYSKAQLAVAVDNGVPLTKAQTKQA